jgi:hypothetical protein
MRLQPSHPRPGPGMPHVVSGSTCYPIEFTNADVPILSVQTVQPGNGNQ